MKVLQLHNRYVRQGGGEDDVMEFERELLSEHGNVVEQFMVSNDTLEVGGLASIKAGANTVWSRRYHRILGEILHRGKPDIVHVHNTFPRLSPSVYWAAAAEHVPVVQMLHNYRLTCANGLLTRDRAPCELCVGHAPWPALRYKCYRGSLAATGAVVAMQATHRRLGTYEEKVDAYIVATEFARSVMVRSGIPEELVHVKPNFVPEPPPSLIRRSKRPRQQVVFVGRLNPEKGAALLLESWRRLNALDARLVIVGDGPERAGLEREFGDLGGVVWRGWLEREDLLDEIADSRYLVIPSVVYETFGMVSIEAFSVGTPVIAPGHAGFPEIVTPNDNGLLFAPRSVEDLAETLERALRLDDATWRRWSDNARRAYLSRYTPEENYRLLVAIYEQAIEQARRRA